MPQPEPHEEPIGKTNERPELPSKEVALQNRSAAPEVAAGVKRVVFLFLAGVTFVLGVLGAVLPGLPTTPFLLLTSYFLMRSSPRLNAALLRSRFFGPILTDWQIYGGVRRDVKAQAITVVILAVAATIYFSGRGPLFGGSVVLVALIGIGVIVKLPVPRDSERQNR